RAMAWSLCRVEEPRELAEAEARHPPGEEPASEPHRVHNGRADPGAGEPLGLAVEKREVEARVVSDEDGVAGEGEEALDGLGRPGRSPQLFVPQPRDGAGPRCDREARVDEGLELGFDLEAAHSHSADLADPGLTGAQSGRLEVDDDVCRILEQEG